MINKILVGHVSPETAFVVNDYPYGFRLRCKIRYWLDSSVNKGVRFMSQTTNPKIEGAEIWNKPKASTYCRFGGAMYLDEHNHVAWAGAHEYQDIQELTDFKTTFYAGLPETFRPVFDKWLEAKTAYEKLKELKKQIS